MKLTPEQKEIALRVARESTSPSGASINNYVGDQMVIEFVERFLAALPKPEPIGYVMQYAIDHLTKHGQTVINHAPLDVTDIALYAAPQDTTAIEQRVAEACAKVCLDRAKIEKSKAVSSRYYKEIAMAQMYDQNSKQSELLSKEIVEQWREFL